MKLTLLSFLFHLALGSQILIAQTGINTTKFSPGVAFEVTGDGTQGVILTRSNIEDLNTEAPFPENIEDGTLTFNTNVASGMGYVWWDNSSHTWRFVDPYIGKKELYGNPIANTAAGNLNQNFSVGYKIPLFGHPEFQDNDNLYEVITPSGESDSKNLKLNFDGRYRIAVTLGLEAQDNAGTLQDDNIVEVRIKITDPSGNVSYPGAYQHSTEMEDTRGNEDDDGAVSFVEILELNQGDVISIVSYRSSISGPDRVELNGSRPSSFYIIKIN